MGTIKITNEAREQLKRRAIHEAGHALMSWVVGWGWPAKLSICPNREKHYTGFSEVSVGYRLASTPQGGAGQLMVVIGGALAVDYVFGSGYNLSGVDLQERNRILDRWPVLRDKLGEIETVVRQGYSNGLVTSLHQIADMLMDQGEITAFDLIESGCAQEHIDRIQEQEFRPPC